MPAWFSSLLSGMGSWLVNPGIFLAGAALVSVPIVIHLLNRRKFKIVDWAAMDFLLEADKKNRRRVRLENFLLLLLRCLAIFLLGLLLARPYDSSGLAAKLFDAQQFERVILVDDSLSMKARVGNRLAMEITRDRLTDLVRQFAAEQADNTITLLVTSNPEQRKLNATPVNAKNVDETLVEIDDLQAGDQPARLTQSLLELDHYLSNQPANVNRVVYVLSDMRRHDWQPPAEGENNASQPLELLRKIAKNAKGCFVIDVAESEDRNLIVSDVKPEKTLVAGVESRFEVQVANPGSQDATNVKVKFSAGDSVPVTQELDRLPAGENATLQFSYQFADDSNGESEPVGVQSRKVKVELQAEKGGEEDRLQEDSTFYVAARVIPGIPTLIVDGDPSASFGKSEAFYLRRSLRPAGKTNSGIAPQVVTENELETLDLSKFSVIFLCNLYRINEKPLEELRKWVAAGGGLVIMPGEQVDEQYFNEHLYGSGDQEGRGLSPVRFETILGDETERVWAGFKVEDEQHPILSEFAGQQNPLLHSVKVFRWWKLQTAKPNSDLAPPQILARLTDAEESLAMVERPFGKGRVIVTAIPADADWTSWTSDPSYILSMQLMVRYLTTGDTREALIRVGEPLRKVIDLSQIELDAELVLPGEKKTHLQATQLKEGENPAAESSRWLLEQKQTNAQGFYELRLANRTGGNEGVLYAANVDPAEGDLRRANTTEMERQLRDVGVRFMSGVGTGMGGIGAQVEIWKYLLWLLVALLLGEQVLGWFFGLRR